MLIPVIVTLVFFAMDAHHELIYMFVKSYELLPAGQAKLNNITNDIISNGGNVFATGVKIAAPVVIGMMITNILLGFIYKAAPQINIFFVSLPVNIFIGFLIMFVSIPVFIHVVSENFSVIKETMYRIILLAKG